MTIDMESQLVRSGDLVESEVDDEVLMMSVETGSYYGLNRTGARVWTLLAQPCRIGSICDELEAAFDVDRGVCEREVLAFVRELASAGLVRPSNHRTLETR